MRRSMIQIDGDGSEDDDDMSFVESDGDAGGSLDFTGETGYGRGVSVRSTPYGGGGYGGGWDGGAAEGDAYSFDFPFDAGKAAPYTAEGLNLDGGPRKTATAKSSMAATSGRSAAAKPAAKSQSSTFGAGSAKAAAGGGAKTAKVNLDDKFDLGRFNIDRKPSKQATAPKSAKDDFDDLDAFLNASDSDGSGVKAKPSTSAVSSAARDKAAALIDEAEASDSEEDSAAPSPAAARTPAVASAVQDAPEDSPQSRSSSRSAGSDTPAFNIMRQESPISAGSLSQTSHGKDLLTSPRSVSSAGSNRSVRRENIQSVSQLAAQVIPSTKATEPPARTEAAPSTALNVGAPAGAKPVAAVAGSGSFSPEEVSSVMSPRQATATGTYTEDFAGESTNQALGSQAPALMTYDDDFEPEADAQEATSKESASSTPPASKERQEQEAMQRRLKELEAQMAAPSVQTAPATKVEVVRESAGTATTRTGDAGQVEVTSRRQSRRPVRSDSDDDDYRPRRPTCHQGVQVSIPVDVGVQCDPPPPDPRPPDDPFGAWVQAAAAAHAAQTAAGSHPSMFGAAYGGLPPQFGGHAPVAAAPPGGAYGGMPFGPPWYPYSGGPGYGLQPQAFAPPPQGPSPVLRQLFSAAIGSGSRGASYLGRPREAWGPTTAPACESATAEGSAPMPAVPGVPGDAASTAALLSALSMLGGNPGYPGSYASTYPGITPHMAPPMAPPMATREDGGPYSVPPPAAPAGVPPMALALGMVNSSFQEPISALRQAVERHRALLEKRLPPEAIGPAGSRE